MADINYRSNQVKLNVPSKVLSVSVTSVNGESYWDHANGADDKWYSGSANKKYYRWTVTFNVTSTSHGSHLTRDDFSYNGLDIVVGDWIAGASTGTACKIISISAKTNSSVTCVVEDWLRYNTFKSSTGIGVFGNGTAVVFTLNENGLPLLDPLPGGISSNFAATIFSRFNYLNPQLNYPLNQTAHGFAAGDIVSVTSDGFVKANSITMEKMVGTVVEPGPGPDYFMISPNNRIIDFDPKIPGTQGDFVYVQSDGSLGTTDTGKAAYLNIQSAIPTVLTGTLDDPEVPANHVVKLNFVDVTCTSNSANANVSEIASAINTLTSNHNVVANVFPTPTVVTSDSSGTGYGLIGGIVPFSGYIDSGSGNTLVNITTTTAGNVAYPGYNVAAPEDIATDINAAGIANLTATFNGITSLTLTETNGNAIYLYPGNVDATGYPFVGTNATGGNVTGLPAVTAAPGTDRLKLTRSDGGEILIYESTEYFRGYTGISSGHTGMFPLAMNIEQGIRKAGTTVVADITARDALRAAVGDQAHVLNKGDGEWGLYIYDGSSWVMLSNEDSATVDAKTLSTTFTMPASGFGIATTQLLGNVSPGRRILNVVVDVGNAFVGASSTPNIQVGTIVDPDAYVPATSNAIDEAIQFEYNPNYTHPSTETQDLEVRARCTHNGATSGSVTVKLTYI